ncbi:hypothetical protein [Hymenobacter persicinus]|uniref:Uncharacterized protein n=1 Tax=Hymenobacter persicinus TaxID=2025506 RepID=A0A4Q5L9J4_9BACT|nr:hypothetical protein [Hymenobacter persicinus]RYU78433.1 hypothetical protein EWM57_14150 [Hymenobacter persicinus]
MEIKKSTPYRFYFNNTPAPADYQPVPYSASASSRLRFTAGRPVCAAPGFSGTATPELAPRPLTPKLDVGGYQVGEEGDINLFGHPDIRY